VRISLYLSTGTGSRREVTLIIKCRDTDWQLSSLTQICSSSLPFLSTVESLSLGLYEGPFRSQSLDYVEVPQWLELLQPFTAVKTLYLRDELVLHVMLALQAFICDGETEVLLALRQLLLYDYCRSGVQEAILRFASERELLGRPVETEWRIPVRWKSEIYD